MSNLTDDNLLSYAARLQKFCFLYYLFFGDHVKVGFSRFFIEEYFDKFLIAWKAFFQSYKLFKPGSNVCPKKFMINWFGACFCFR
jgi:hypothetical protein